MILAQPIHDPLIQWLTGAGVTGILAMLVVAFMRDWIVSGTAYERVLDERDRALAILAKNAEVAQRAVDLAINRLELEAELRKIQKEEDRGLG